MIKTNKIGLLYVCVCEVIVEFGGEFFFFFVIGCLFLFYAVFFSSFGFLFHLNLKSMQVLCVCVRIFISHLWRLQTSEIIANLCNAPCITTMMATWNTFYTYMNIIFLHIHPPCYIICYYLHVLRLSIDNGMDECVCPCLRISASVQ